MSFRPSFQSRTGQGDYQLNGIAVNRVPLIDTEFDKLMNPKLPCAFFDNPLSIFQLCEFNSQSTSFQDAIELKHILIRPRRTGKTVFGMMWLEFMKGDPNNLLARTQLKQKHAHLFPKPGEFVCVHLDFSGVSMSDLTEMMIDTFNQQLDAKGLETIPRDFSCHRFSSFECFSRE